MTDSFVHEINQQLAQLTPGQQQDVLQFVKQIRSQTSKEERNRMLEELAGSISPDDIAIMKSAIENDCGR